MLAFVREVSPRLAHCELTHLERGAIDPARATRQHGEYVSALASLGCEIEWLAPLPAQADGMFVEDTAVIVPEVAVVTRPGVASRRAETASVSTALARHVPVIELAAPACLEGGDVLRIGRRLWAGTGGRTNAEGVAQLAAALAPHGYRVDAVPLEGCLHLKSACSFIPPDTLLVNPEWADPAIFGTRVVIEVAEDEPYGANALSVGGRTLASTAYPKTLRRVAEAGIGVQPLEVSEIHKAEAALTCMSLLLPRVGELD